MRPSSVPRAVDSVAITGKGRLRRALRIQSRRNHAQCEYSCESILHCSPCYMIALTVSRQEPVFRGSLAEAIGQPHIHEQVEEDERIEVFAKVHQEAKEKYQSNCG